MVSILRKKTKVALVVVTLLWCSIDVFRRCWVSVDFSTTNNINNNDPAARVLDGGDGDGGLFFFSTKQQDSSLSSAYSSSAARTIRKNSTATATDAADAAAFIAEEDMILDTIEEGEEEEEDRHPELLTTNDLILLKEGVRPRAYSRWDTTKFPLPCYKGGVRSSKTKGFLFTKPPKSGSSTAASINLRIATKLSKKNKRNKKKIPSLQSICACWLDHGQASKLGYGNRTIGTSFLWAMVRAPTSRLVSEFFHFEVSRAGRSSNDTTFQNYLKDNANFRNHNIRYLMLSNFPPGQGVKPRRQNFTGPIPDPVGTINSIIQSYDFIGVTERFDESVVVLQMLLGLNTSDVLVMSSKESGAYDDGRYHNRCTLIQKSVVSNGMKQYFNSTEYRNAIYWDEVFHVALNRALDMTIEELGRSNFERALQQYQYAKNEISKVCTPETVKLPCNSDGVKRKVTDCVRYDTGCGDDCINNVLSKLDTII